jgi:pimeloyl-ACP methyl ester carboxylesterase
MSRSGLRLHPAIVLAGLLSISLPASAEVPCGNFSSSLGQCINTQLTVGGTSYNVDWYLPNATASGLMTLQHGFSRGCGNLRNTSKAIMEKGVMVLCLNADVSGGNPALGQALGDTLNARNLTPPQGKPLPVTYIVGGHSAGGHFATAVGARLTALGYPALAGTILFDPVASGGFTDNLEAISAGGGRPVLVVAARPSAANLFNNAFGGLQQIANPYVGLQLVWSGYFFGIPYGGSCHTDVEGENGDVVGNLAAGCTPDSTQVARLRDFGSNWARDLATGTRTAAYYCDNAQNKVNCGSKVTSLVNGVLPKALLVPTS